MSVLYNKDDKADAKAIAKPQIFSENSCAKWDITSLKPLQGYLSYCYGFLFLKVNDL